MNAAITLESYGIFSDKVVGTLGEVAERLGNLSYEQALNEFNVPEPELHTAKGFKTSQVLDVIPRGGYDRTLAIQTEISTGIDPNSIMHLIPIIGSLPTTRLVAFGRPARWGNSYNLLTRKQAQDVADGDFKALALPTLDYLRSNRHERIEEAVHAGFSLGGDVVPEIPLHAEQHDHKVEAVISMDGVTGHSRHPFKLLFDFLSIQKAWKGYMAEVDSPAYTEARKLGHNDNPLAIGSSFMRLSTIDIWRGLAKGGMEERLDASLSLEANHDMKAVIINCGESELSDRDVMTSIRSRLQARHGERVSGEALEGLKHAVNDQIFANGAILLHGLELAKIGF